MTRREDRKRWRKEQQALARWAQKNQAPVEYAIVWKRKEGFYESGATGST